jgi:hypothetical protein
LPADRASFRHFGKILEGVSTPIGIQITHMAFGALKIEDTVKFASFGQKGR